MWRYVSRSIRNSLKRQKYAFQDRSSRKRHFVRNVKPESNTFLTTKLNNYEKSGFESAKENKTREDDKSKWETKHTWQEAFGWSGVIAICWGICQLLYTRKTLDEIWNLSTGKMAINFDLQLSDLMTHIKNFEPKKMLSYSKLQQSFESEEKNKEATSVAFSSINHEEFDMLIHRQQSF